MSIIPKLIFDIETVGVDFDSLDKMTQESLTSWIERSSTNKEEYNFALAGLKDELGFSPLTGEIVAIGALDLHQDKGAVYFQAPGKKIPEETEGGIVYRPMTEKQILEKFWELAKSYNHFITFNGRQFDAPFMMLRSAIHGIRPSKDLMKNRYLNYQNADALHIDLYDQLSFYGSTRKKGTLHLYCRAFGIKSPKEDGTTGYQVSDLFKAKKYMEIAKYNAGDLFSTRELYRKWEDYLQF